MTPDDRANFRSDLITAAIAVEFGSTHTEILHRLSITRSKEAKPLYSTLASKTATEFNKLVETI